MSFYRRFVADLSGLNQIRAASSEGRGSPVFVDAELDARFQLRGPDHGSKGQVVVAREPVSATDKLSSEELSRQSREAMRAIHQLTR